MRSFLRVAQINLIEMSLRCYCEISVSCSGAGVTVSLPAIETVASPHGEVAPLCVDLDGTLVQIDTLEESASAAVFDDWRVLLGIPGWLLEGKARLRAELAK